MHMGTVTMVGHSQRGLHKCSAEHKSRDLYVTLKNGGREKGGLIKNKKAEMDFLSMPAKSGQGYCA